MSRAFVNDDDQGPPPRAWPLPSPDDPGYDAAATTALLEAARIGETSNAEEATGIAWGDPRLRLHVERLRDDAIAASDERLEQVAERYLAVGGT